MIHLRLIYFWLFCLTFASCASRFPVSTQPEPDSGPSTPVDVSLIADATPRPVVRTKAGNYSPYRVLGKTYTVLLSSNDFVEQGTASWYGRKFHGRLTANGEKFDMYAMTAAHKHLPIPTYVKVTNLDNGKRAILRVNDRGPFHGDRVIDLSWAAAAKLGFADQGTAPVRIVALDPDDPQLTLAQLYAASSPPVDQQNPLPVVKQIPRQFALGAESYYQVALLSVQESAEALAAELETYTKFPVRIDEETAAGGSRYRLLIGPLVDRREAHTLGLILELAGMSPGFITRLNK